MKILSVIRSSILFAMAESKSIAVRTSQTGNAAAPEEPKVIVIKSREELIKLLEDARNKHVLLEFFATWCGPCRMVAKLLDDLAIQYAAKAIICKIDVDDLEEIAAEYNVTSMPTFILFHQKSKVEVFTGSKFEAVLKGLEKHVGPLAQPEAEVTTNAAAPAPTAGPAPAPKSTTK